MATKETSHKPKKPAAARDAETISATERGAATPTVGIGASAGGLEAFERFFRHLPADSGFAYVLVQHLAPTHKSMLNELVQRFTRMPVNQAEDGQQLEPDQVYTIPPNRDIGLLNGRLQLLEPIQPHGLRLPIDYFFNSLAQDLHDDAICIILSGTGTDGTLGLRSVKDEGGLVFAQTPESAAYDGMPSSAIRTGMVDLVLPPEAIPEQLIHYRQKWLMPGTAAKQAMQNTAKLDKVMLLLRAQTGHDFTQYKPGTLGRRVERRMMVNQLVDPDKYIALLQRNGQEAKILFREMLIGVTRFFRDREAFELLEEQTIPDLCANRSTDQPLRIWVCGCATGEEAYTIALLLRRYMDDRHLRFQVQIFATDLDPEAIEIARSATYPESILADLPEDLLRRYFIKKNHAWQLTKSIREMLVFAVQSVIKDPPFSNLEMISCRNLLIYLQPSLQRRVLSTFHYVLKPNGWLLLGSSESIGPLADRFRTLSGKWRLYLNQALDTHEKWERNSLETAAVPPPASRMPEGYSEDLNQNIQQVTERSLLEHYSPVGITIDERGNMLYVSGHTGMFLETTTGEASLNLLKLARDDLRPALRHAIRQAVAHHRETRCEVVKVQSAGMTHLVKLSVRPIHQPTALNGLLLVVLEDLGAQAEEIELAEEHDPRISKLRQELKSTRDFLQSSNEQLESANEELISTNEKLLSSNEEMQSTNEELETSQEELRSLNEELMTVNTELQTNMEELNRSNNDLSNLMTSTDLAIVFLDEQLKIRRFTPAATQLLHLVDTDIGRPLKHTVTDFDYDHLVKDVENLLDTLVPQEKEIQTRNGRWYLMRLRAYRTLEHVIAGAVITFIDIHSQKQGEELKRLTMAVEQSPSSVIMTDQEGAIVYVNPRFSEITGYTSQEALGQTPNILKSSEHPNGFYRNLWKTLISGHVWRGELRNRRKNGELYWESAIISPVKDTQGRVTHYVSVQEDITNRKLLEADAMAHALRYRSLVENMSSGVAVYEARNKGEDFVFLDFNKAGERIEGVKREELIGHSVHEVFPGVVEFGLFEVFQRVWKTGEPASHPVSFYQDDKISGWRESYVYKLPSGEIVVIYDDVSEKMRNEQALINSERKLQSVLDSSAEGIFALDLAGICTLANPTCVKLLGYADAAELTGQSMHELIHHTRPDGTPYPVEECMACLVFETGEVTHTENEVYWRRDGASLPVSYISHPLIHEGEVKGTVVVFSDISERKKTEREMMNLFNRYQLILDTSIDGFWITDTGGRILEVNDAYCRMIGFSRAELLSMNVHELELDEDQSESTAQAGKLKEIGHAQFTKQHRRKDGSTLRLSVSENWGEMDGEAFIFAFLRDLPEEPRPHPNPSPTGGGNDLC
ncbi:MAG: PAS domain S-box protein [Pseudomonadota bacterium]